MTGPFHLTLSLHLPGHVRSAWRLPGHDPFSYLDVTQYRRLAQAAERAKVHAVFVGDRPVLGPGIAEGPEAGLDPAVLLSNVAASTERIGFVITSSSTYEHPYSLARRFAAIDHVTGGRAGVNVVTTYAPHASANFGLAQTPSKAERYRRAEEFLDVLRGLWDGWEPGALIGDQGSGRFADPAKIHPLGHDGEFFAVRGPLSVPASPQGRPVVVQAGGSPGGVRLAGRHADVVFAVAQTLERAVEFRSEIRAAALAAGRSADAVQVSLGVVVIVAATEDEARRRERELYATIPIEKAVAGLAAQLGLDPATLSPDDVVRLEDLPVPLVEAASGGFQASTRALLAAGPLPAREIVHRGAGGAGHRLLVGSAEQVADDLEHWFRAGAADGFTIMPADTATDFEAFTDLVVPLLQQRGSFQTDYPGRTLRENLGLPSTPEAAPRLTSAGGRA